MYTYNVLTIAIIGLGMVSGQNLEGSAKCYKVTCQVNTKDNWCINRGAHKIPDSVGNPSVNGNSITFYSKVFPFQTYAYSCPRDPDTTIVCQRPGPTIACPGQGPPRPATQPNSPPSPATQPNGVPRGSGSCRLIKCDVVTSNNACVNSAARAMNIVWGNGQVSGNSFTYTAVNAPSGTSRLNCDQDPNTQINCQEIGDAACPGMGQLQANSNQHPELNPRNF